MESSYLIIFICENTLKSTRVMIRYYRLCQTHDEFWLFVLHFKPLLLFMFCVAQRTIKCTKQSVITNAIATRLIRNQQQILSALFLGFSSLSGLQPFGPGHVMNHVPAGVLLRRYIKYTDHFVSYSRRTKPVENLIEWRVHRFKLRRSYSIWSSPSRVT